MPSRTQILQRLRRIEGQIKGIQNMIESERLCGDILTQMLAARAALDKSIASVVEANLEHCMESQSPEELKETMMRWMDLVLRSHLNDA